MKKIFLTLILVSLSSVIFAKCPKYSEPCSFGFVTINGQKYLELNCNSCILDDDWERMGSDDENGNPIFIYKKTDKPVYVNLQENKVIYRKKVASSSFDNTMQETYKRWACANTCTKTYTETETNYLGNKITYECVACKHEFCMMPTGEQIFWKDNIYRKFNQDTTYPFVYRWVKY